MSSVVIADIQSKNNNGRSEGHYFSVAENYQKIFAQDGKVLVAGGPVYEQKFIDVIRLPFDSLPEKKTIVNKFHTFINGLYLVRKNKYDTIIFQCSAVSIVLLILALIPTRNKIFLIQYDNMIKQSRIKRFLFHFAKKRISGIVCPGEEIGKQLELPFCVVPDYIFCENETPICEDKYKYDFGIFGILSRDKGVLEAASYFSGKPCTMKIAGRSASLEADREMMIKLRELCDKFDNIELTEGYLSDEDYYRCIKESKYMVLNYKGTYETRSSGVILDAIYQGTPVVVRDREYVSFVRDNNLGYVYDSIEEIDWDKLLDDNCYKEYRESIILYLKKQQAVAEKLKLFIRG